MNFDLSEDQQLLVDTVGAWVRKESPLSRARALRQDPLGWSREVWRKMGEQGWLGVAFPEAVGGVGGSFVDAALLLEPLGAALAPEPFGSLLSAGAALVAAGDAAQQARWLAPAVAGQQTIALAWAEAQSRYDAGDLHTRAERSGAGWRIDGKKRFVLDGHAADTLVVSARTDHGLSLFVVDAAAVTRRAVPTLDGRRAALVELEGVEVGPDRLLGGEGAGMQPLERALDVGAAAACAEGVGILRASLMMTVEYLRTREQFGVKIGSFQALQHRAVDMFIEAELCRSASLRAALEIDADEVTRKTAVSAAKVQLAESGRFVTQQAIQLHGGIGITDEHDIGLYFKRMHALNAVYGDEEHHLARFGALPSFAQNL